MAVSAANFACLGVILVMTEFMLNAELFWSHVHKSDGCWEWTGARTKKGYGVFGRTGVKCRTIKAHRAAFLITHGHLPVYVLHRCDNPPCVRPDHLYEGTAAENTSDMISRRRAPWQTGRQNA